MLQSISSRLLGIAITPKSGEGEELCIVVRVLTQKPASEEHILLERGTASVQGPVS